MTNTLINHFLLPTDNMQDPRFFGALVYICRYSQDGAWGFIVNEPLAGMSVGGLLGELRIDGGSRAMMISAMNGGFLRPEAGFVLHTGLPNYDSSFAIGENISLTTSRDILPLLMGEAVSHFLLVMGFCSWKKGQLEDEIKRGDWLTCPADAGILFHPDNSQKLALAYKKLGLSEHHASLGVGFA